MPDQWHNRITGYGEEAPDTLLANPRNFRRHPKHQQDALAGVLRDVGVVQDVILNRRTGFLIDGHLRVSLAVRDGQATIPVKYVDLSEDEEALILATLDPIAALATVDAEILENLLREVTTGDAAVQAMLDALAVDAGIVPGLAVPGGGGDDFDTTPDDGPTRVQRGELWQLGDHRLLCGDSTNADDVARLMGGERVGMVFTDPPYGMSYKGVTFGKGGIRNDGEDEWQEILSVAISLLSDIATDVVIAICFAPARLHAFFEATKPLRFHRRLTIYKPNRMAKPWHGWIMTSEDIYLFSLGSPIWNDTNHCHDVYTHDYSERPDRSVDHPTVKPLSIVQDVVGKCSRPDTIILDSFLGSGTTLIAAERTGRRCYGMEIEPKYCDVIIRRWEAETGRSAEKVG